MRRIKATSWMIFKSSVECLRIVFFSCFTVYIFMFVDINGEIYMISSTAHVLFFLLFCLSNKKNQQNYALIRLVVTKNSTSQHRADTFPQKLKNIKFLTCCSLLLLTGPMRLQTAKELRIVLNISMM